MKNLTCIGAIFFLNGCHLEKPWVHQLDVQIKNNAPCFKITSDIKTDHQKMKNQGVMIYKKSQQDWLPFWHTPQKSTFPDIFYGECISYPDVKWQEGRWSVLMGITTDDDKKKYRLINTFSLRKDEAGNFFLENIQ
ncbi:putative T6SS immunity periplasmic lipoprotein [Erwinia papayae]|uniref:T6SS immunity periplasmic lipoprotein n=1 Tax=Erwinia papayae TaxID=206499 RepID=A0ABV3N2T2_9GAMM